jgi:hypothetical protein
MRRVETVVNELHSFSRRRFADHTAEKRCIKLACTAEGARSTHRRANVVNELHRLSMWLADHTA